MVLSYFDHSESSRKMWFHNDDKPNFSIDPDTYIFILDPLILASETEQNSEKYLHCFYLEEKRFFYIKKASLLTHFTNT